MLVASFGPSTAWVGKTISYDDGRFTLEDFGEIAAQAVVDYDRQGHLVWAYDGLREWAYQAAGQPEPAAATAAPAAETASPATPPAETISPAAAAAPAEATALTQPAEPVGSAPAGEVAPHLAPPMAPPTASPVTPPTASPVTPPTASPVAPPTASPVAPPTTSPVTPSAAPPTEATQPAAGQGPVPAAAAGPAPSAPPEAAGPAPAAGKSRLGWFIFAGVVIVALIVGVLATGGRLRDGLGVAFTLLAVAAVIALIVAAVKPAALGRWFGGAGSRALLVTCGAVAASCFVLAAVLWWMPHYEVVAPADKRIALDDQRQISLQVVNRGLIGGTYSAAYAVDGLEQDAVAFPLGGGDARELTLSLPAEAERGPVLLTLGGASIEAQAVLPPAFTVAPLQIDPAPAKLGDDVVLTTTVQNTGDLAGTFDGALLVGGDELMAQPVKVAPGQSVDVTYDLTADAAGEYELTLGDATAAFVIVEPVRLANGYVIRRSISGGRSSVTIVNKTGSDAVAVFSRSSNKRKPVLAVYIRAGKKAKVGGIPDGKYVFWDSCGSDFNWTMRDFYTPVEYKRWLDPLEFDTTKSTRHWTSYWSDAYYNYSQGHSQTTTHWTNWTLTMGTGESKYTKLVSEDGFPQF